MSTPRRRDTAAAGGMIASNLMPSHLRSVSDRQTREIPQPIYYDDGKVIHACESTIMHPLCSAGLDEVRHRRARR